MTWSDRLMSDLDRRANVLQTAHGEVQLAREGDGPPVLVLHGGPGGFDQALAWSRHLRDGGCDVLAPSRPGYLRTPLQSGPQPHEQADLWAAMLDTLGIDRVTIYGFSSGAPSAVQLAARHADRTAALFLDSPILLPFEAPIGRFRQAAIESGPVVWLSYQLARRKPGTMTSFMIDGVSEGLDTAQKQHAAEWIMADPERLRSVQEQWMSIAPRRHRRAGWTNDQANEVGLEALPFADIAAPTLIAHGTNDAIVPIEHPTAAARAIAGAESILVEEGHHLLSVSRNYTPVVERQLEMVHRPSPA